MKSVQLRQGVRSLPKLWRNLRCVSQLDELIVPIRIKKVYYGVTPVQLLCKICPCCVTAVPFSWQFHSAGVEGSAGSRGWHWVGESSWEPALSGGDRAGPSLPCPGFSAGRMSSWATFRRIPGMCRSPLGWWMSTTVGESIWHCPQTKAGGARWECVKNQVGICEKIVLWCCSDWISLLSELLAKLKESSEGNGFFILLSA